jgi:hypothetical protein
MIEAFGEDRSPEGEHRHAVDVEGHVAMFDRMIHPP